MNPGLTAWELDVLRLMGQGFGVAANARTLGISAHTCRGYVKAILRKLDAHSQLEAVAAANRLGILGGGGRDRGSAAKGCGPRNGGAGRGAFGGAGSHPQVRGHRSAGVAGRFDSGDLLGSQCREGPGHGQVLDLTQRLADYAIGPVLFPGT